MRNFRRAINTVGLYLWGMKSLKFRSRELAQVSGVAGLRRRAVFKIKSAPGLFSAYYKLRAVSKARARSLA